MATLTKRLPREVSALVHHVELNKAGWWNKTLERLMLAAVWLTGSNPQKHEIEHTLKNSFGLSISSEKTSRIILKLIDEQLLIQVTNGQFRIPEQVRKSLEQEIKSTEQNEKIVIAYFQSLAAKYCPEIDAYMIWTKFEDLVLLPLVRDIGANTYNLLTGEMSAIESNYSDKFIEYFGHEHRDSLKEISRSFMDSNMDDVRGYISRLLHAQFCVESSGLSQNVIDRWAQAIGKSTQFRLFVDTNFLFSLLGLHENPSNNSAQELKTLLSTLAGNPQVSFHVTPRTIDEAKKAIIGAKFQARNIPPGSNFTSASLRSNISGITQKYLMEHVRSQYSLKVDDWFDPYLNSFALMARSAGVEVFNENTDSYSTRQDVVDDINRVLKYEENYPEDRRKSYEAISHDIVLWHLVKDKRPTYIESPANAREWILTLDFRFIGFDQHKLKTNGAAIPVCLHPTSLIQLLQFWVPRSKEFEIAMLGGMRLPFLFQEFDIKAEQTSVAIISKLGRFEGNEGFSEETIFNVVVNEGLRARIREGHSEEVEVQLVRDALVEELNIELQSHQAKAKQALLEVELEKQNNKSLEAELKVSGAALAISSTEKIERDQIIEQLQQELNCEREAVKHLEIQKNKLIETIHEEHEESKRKENRKKSVRLAQIVYLTAMFFALVVSGFAGWQSKHLFLSYINNLISLYALMLTFGISVFITLHLLFEKSLNNNSHILHIWPFKLMRRFRYILWFILATVWLGAIGSFLSTIFPDITSAT